jgi:cytochrome c-type biogenesis protein CcmH/NrfG
VLIAAALVIVTVATYAPVWRFAFVALDDPQYVSSNPNIAGGLSAQSFAWAMTTGREANWHPVTWLSHAMDISLFGLNSGRHHVVNLLLHLVNTLLLFAVLRRMTRSTGASAFVAALFGVHPLHVESVAWVAERKDVLSALFFMLTLGAYARYVERPTPRRYGLVALFLAIGLMAKAMLVTVPMVLLLLDYWPLRRQKSWTSLAIEKLPLFGLVAASSIVTFLVQKQGGAVKSLESFPFALRLQNAAVSYVDYLRMTVWPVNLGVFYPFPSELSAGVVAISVVALAVVTVGAIWLARRVPAVAVGWLWFLGMLVPVIGLVQIGGQARADRYMYLPLIGLAIAAAWGVLAIARTPALRRVAAGTGILIVVSSAVVGHAQVQYWSDTVTLWTHTAAATEGSENFGVYFGLAEYLRANGRAAESIPVYEASITRNSTYLEARLGLVRAYVDTHQTAKAIAALQEVVAQKPDNVEARMSLGFLLGESGRLPEAIAQFAEAVRARPDDPQPRNDYAQALAQNRQFAEAAREWETVIRAQPASTAAHLNLAIALLQLGRLDEAATHLHEVLRQDPNNDTAKKALAAIGR